MNNQNQAEYCVYQGVLQQNLKQVQEFWDLQTRTTFRKEILVCAFDGESDEIFLFVADRSTNEDISRNICYTFSKPYRFQYLLPRADLTYGHSHALSWAAQMGDLSIVEHLLPFSVPNDPECIALYNAVFEEHYEIVDLLFPVSNIKATMEHLISNEYDCQPQIQFLQEKMNTVQNHNLQKEVGHQGISRVKKL